MKPRLCIVLAACAISLTGLGGTPASGDIFGVGAKKQVELGRQAAADIRKKQKVLPVTDPKVRTLRRVGQRLLSTLPTNIPWEFSFDVIDSKELNAFSLPGGPTFFYTGLLDKLKTEDELAGVLGHEMTHVLKEHWARHYKSSQERNALLTVGLAIFHANRDIGSAVSLGNNLWDLKFSRGEETQADDGGFDMMIAAGYNPQGMADVFEMLTKASGSGKPPEFLSDHPADAARVRRIEDKIKATHQDYPPLRSLDYNRE